MKTPTSEQLKIIESEGNIVVNAKPGSGKTFVLVEKINLILTSLKDYQGIIAISFTNKASDEILNRTKYKSADIKNSFFGTIDKFYINEIIIPFSHFLTNKQTEFNILEKEDFKRTKYSVLFDEEGNFREADFKNSIISMLFDGIIFIDRIGEIAYYVMSHVKQCIIYLKTRYKYIMIDEYQDCGEIQHNIFTFLVKSGLTGIAVGDLNQAIYGFSGRKSEFLKKLICDSSFTKFDLNKNFRCHQTISNYSLALLNDPFIEEPVKDTRMFYRLISGNEASIANYIDDNIDKIIKKFSSEKTIKRNQVAILVRGKRTGEIINESLKIKHKYCEQTPLDTSILECDRIFKNILRVVVSKEITPVDFTDEYFAEGYDDRKIKQVYKILNKLKAEYLTREDLKENIDKFEEITLLVLNESDKIDLKNIKKVLEDEKLFNSFIPGNEDEVLIMTIHSSKGLEFEIVFHLDLYKYILPSRGWTIDGNKNELIESLNLHYVAITRAVSACFLISSTSRTKFNGDQTHAESSEFLYYNKSLSLMRNSKKV